jgi:hypothetical protein
MNRENGKGGAEAAPRNRASRRRQSIAAAAVVLAVFCGLGIAADLGTNHSGGSLPLTVDKSAPLLLDEPTSDQSGGATSPSLTRKLICHDCHADFLQDSLSVVHAKQDIACTSCHGLSEAHSGDEENITPPQIMYARGDIAGKCRQCHKTHNATADAVITRWQQRDLQRLKPAELACTDCHGEHRMRVRTVLWDKHTGKLLPKKRPSEK